MSAFNVGSIVRCRNREWVMLPSPNDEVILLRPLTGGESEICGIHRQLANLGFDRVEPATFPLPKAEDSADAIGAELLWNAARVSLRDGAGPFRSLGRISIRPRPYQFVPLLMALRLDPVRMLISDDVGVGKTIEALLVARELLDRGEIRRICVLCPPYLCDQWQKELWEKFSIDAVVVRSGTVGQLERNVPGDRSVFGHYPHIVVSIDYAKSDRHRANFLLHCPELVIVDEAHGAAEPARQARGQQQRHELLHSIAKDPTRHLLMLTATPHSGVEESFRSLLGLLKPEFARLDLQNLTERERDELARHFVQRRRPDVQNWLNEETPFPERDSREETYDLSPKYRDLFERVYRFSSELVRSAETLSGWKRRIRFWTALALLRCVMSSPAAALAALKKRGGVIEANEEEGDDIYAPYIYEPTDEETVDAQPAHIVEEGETDLGESAGRRLREFAALARQIQEGNDDTKLAGCVKIVRGLLRDGYRPIIWCRYIATSDHVAQELQARLGGEFANLRAVSITGALSDDDRRARVEELSQFPHRVLVATDCLSEGINLQDSFDAVIHYDLPWNPNRLEQREGRVDRFGQPSKKVKTILFYGRDNPVDAVVLDVLLRKAKEIRRTLGVTVPVPVDSETVMEAVLKQLFLRGPKQLELPLHGARQMSLFEDATVEDVQKKWDEAVQRETLSRTRFAQRAIKPDEVARELKETDAVLGDPDTVKRFVLNACQRLGISVSSENGGVFALTSVDRLPEMVRAAVPNKANWRVTFTAPAPENVTYLGRNHPFVAGLSEYLLEEALTRGQAATAARCGVVRTKAVDRRTVLLLLRLRFTVEEQDRTPLLAEEVFVCGFRGSPPNALDWLAGGEALDLLQNAQPNANTSEIERQETLEEVLEWWDKLQHGLQGLIEQRAQKLEDAHSRVRAAARLRRHGLKVKPFVPPDLLGIFVLLPIPKGVSR